MLFSFSRSSLPTLALAAVLVSGCGQDTTAVTSTAPSAMPSSAPSVDVAAATAPTASPAPALTITDPWVKATDEGMTAAFGTLVNTTGTDVTVVSAASPLSSKVELHEVVQSGGTTVMRPKEGGFVVPAHGSHELAPGGDHIMLMDITGKVEPGAEVPITLTLADGGTLEFVAVGKEFAGAKENYRPGAGDPHTGGSHGGDEG